MKKFYLKLNWSKEWNFMLHWKCINFWQTGSLENQWTIVSSKTKVSYWLLTTLQKYPNIFSLYERSQQNIWIFQWLRYKLRDMYSKVYFAAWIFLKYIFKRWKEINIFQHWEQLTIQHERCAFLIFVNWMSIYFCKLQKTCKLLPCNSKDFSKSIRWLA